MTLEYFLQNAKGLADDSRLVEPGFLFFCKGHNFNISYLEDAFRKGAIGYVSELDFNVNYPNVIVDDIRKTMADACRVFYDDPSRRLHLAGITGTKGKSTVLYYLKSIMEHTSFCGEGKFGYVSSIDNFDGKTCIESHMTTPEPIELNTLLSSMVSNGLGYAGMEVSSQGLKYGRAAGLHYEVGAFTNFGPDHISENEHTDLEDYFSSKLKLIDQCDRFILNLDADRSDEVLARCMQRRSEGLLKEVITVSASGKTADGCSSYAASDIRKEAGKTVFELSDFGTIRLSMPGLFNVENAMFAAVMARLLGADNKEIAAGLLDAKASGRMEIYKNHDGSVIGIVDYAHNRLSFEKLLGSIREEYPGWNIVTIFGCPGFKAFERRRDLPEMAARYSDYAYITEDDPYDEDPKNICDEVYANLISFGGKGEIVVDRHDAIRKAVENAGPHSVVLALAKGPDKYMHRKEFEFYESDSVLINEEISKR